MIPEPNAASIALFDGSTVLLVKRALPPYQNLWTLPGGRREAGETAEDCAIREAQEEVGLIAREPVQIALQRFSSAGGAEWTLAVFATTRFEGIVTPSDEVCGHCWVSVADSAGLQTTSGLTELLASARLRLDAR